MQSVGIEPTLLRTRALSVRLNRSAKTASCHTTRGTSALIWMILCTHMPQIPFLGRPCLPSSLGDIVPAKLSTPTRFELARAEPNRFLIYLLNHSDTVSLVVCILVPFQSDFSRRMTKQPSARLDCQKHTQNPAPRPSTSMVLRVRLSLCYTTTVSFV